MSATPAFTWTPRTGRAILTAANTSMTGSGTISSILQGAASTATGPGGTRIFAVTCQATVTTTTGGFVRLWISLDNAATWDLHDEIAVEAKDLSVAGTSAARTFKPYNDLTLPNANAYLGATIHLANRHIVWAHGGDLT